ncbi:H-NS family nucleoid-associated regulatory protein [Variovorax sp. J22P240]|uniref:H-NS family nucleoid-associated regulatory protein n=1 Tax=Variovorax sp. J22P240 TaxID=3053514 RepID=UPI002575EB2E|nr:H-NS family nucleoid-associated regulatory protein [Variovorax sp. J22P240]MDM0002617.1 H-NS family nucleoid-associated regulatory protein [Variovorax sp. J22P240]
MTQTYAQIQKQIAQLQKTADALREKEVSGVVSRIKGAIVHYGLTAQQLGFGRTAPKAGAPIGKASDKRPRAAKYSDGNGNAWGGMGKRPQWLRDALDSGRTLEELRIGTVVAAVAKQPGKQKKRRPSTLLYRDGAGNSWTGRGPQPRWMKEAIAGGKTLEDLRG